MKIRSDNILAHAIYCLSFLVGILFILIFYSKQEGQNLDALFNADILYFPTLFKDLFIDHYRPEGWNVPGFPNFFPDMVLYFLIMSLAGSPVISSCLYSIVQFLLIMVLFNILIRIVLPTKDIYLLSVVNTMFSLFVVVGCSGENYTITFHVLSNAYHLGAFINALIALIFTYSYLRYNKNVYLFLLLLIGFIAVSSDRLFLVLYTVPFLMALTLWISKKNLRFTGKLFTVNFIAALSGLTVLQLLRLISSIHIHKIYSDISVEKTISSFHVLMHQMYVFIAAWNLFSFIIIGSILFILSLMIILILRRRELLGVVPVSEQQRLHLIFLAYSLFFMFVVFWTPVILGDYPSNAKIRYIIFVFYYAMLALLPTLIIILRTSKQVNILQSIASILLVLSLTILAITHVSRKEFTYGLKSYFNYYPDIARCLDELKKKYPLKHGVSGYWRAKVGTLFSRENVRLYSVYDVNMVPYKHLENENWYYETGYGRYDPPVFNFVIFSKGDSLGPVYRQLGEPLAREECGDYNFLLVNDYIYKRGEKFPVLKNSVVIKPE